MSTMPKNVEKFCIATHRLAQKHNLTIQDTIQAYIVMAFTVASACDDKKLALQNIQQLAEGAAETAKEKLGLCND
jgi:hypothetical protein